MFDRLWFDRSIHLQEYDRSQFDAFCICLECGYANFDGTANAYVALSEWLLNLSIDLIRPSLLMPTTSGAAGQPHSVLTREGNVDSTDGLSCKIRPEERFSYFTKRLCRARIWNDHNGALFNRLQSKAACYMEGIAELCHARCSLEHSSRLNYEHLQ